jgi:hypothetical protein
MFIEFTLSAEMYVVAIRYSKSTTSKSQKDLKRFSMARSDVNRQRLSERIQKLINMISMEIEASVNPTYRAPVDCAVLGKRKKRHDKTIENQTIIMMTLGKSEDFCFTVIPPVEKSRVCECSSFVMVGIYGSFATDYSNARTVGSHACIIAHFGMNYKGLSEFRFW